MDKRKNVPTGSGFRADFLVVLCFAAFFAVAASQFFRTYPVPARAAAALYVCLCLLLVLAALPAIAAVRAMTERWLERRTRILWLVAIWCVPYLLYGAGTGDFRWSAFARLLAICAPPLLIYTVVPVRNPAALNWQDGLAWTWLVLVVVLREFNGIWNVPVNLDFMARLFAIAVAAWCWVIVRPAPELGYRFLLSLRTVKAALLSFAGFAAVAIPVSFAMRFAGWNPRWHGILDFSASFIEILVFIAWLEELLFRGFLQSLAAQSLRSARAGQLVASLAFGLSHVLLSPAPNWRYVLLASIAGWFYGSAFQRGGNLAAPALTHALVDTVWRTWFRGA